MSSKVPKVMDNLKKGRKNKRKVGDKNVDPTLIARQDISPTKKLISCPEESKDLYCDICKVEFNDLSKKEKHIAVLHNSQKTKDEKKAFASKVKEPIEKPKEFHPCSNCQERFVSKSQLKKHIQNVHPKPKHPTKSKQVSKASFVPTKSPRPPPGPPGPPMSVEEAKEIFCEECGVEFDKSQQLVQHMMSEHDVDITQGVTTTVNTVLSQASDEEGDDLELEEYIPVNVRGSGQMFMDGFEIAEEVVNSDNEEISRLSSGFAKLAHRSDQQLKFLAQRNELELYEGEDDEEMESQENSEDSDEFSSDDEVMIESPKRPAEEITLDEDSDEEIVVEKVRNEHYEKELNNIERYEKFLAWEKAWDILTNDNHEDEDKVRKIQATAWFAKPRNWKPTSQWETWNATVKQICAHYKLIDFRLNDNQRFSSFHTFSDYVTEPMKDLNPKMNEVTLYKWKKAKWLQTLDPVIPDHMKILEETLDDDDE